MRFAENSGSVNMNGPGGVAAPATGPAQPSMEETIMQFKSRECCVCGQDFTLTGPHQHHCSLRCRMEDSYIVCPSGCWMWTGFVHPSGYGHLSYQGKAYKAHRAAYEVWNGPIEGGMAVCHSCDVPGCINPIHLWLGTLADNNADRSGKGRTTPLRGEANGNASITDVQARAIKQRLDECAGQYGHVSAIARELGVPRGIVKDIKRGATWRHI